MGRFTADNVRLVSEQVEGQRRYSLCADVWITPLDLGISQTVQISTVPDSEQPEITYLFFTITRQSGEFETWHRMNGGFLRDLRKQLLIWRLVTPEAKSRLAREAAEILADKAAVG